MSDTRDRLLDAAEDHVRLRGYHAVSFRELASLTGIKSASVHYYFQQKEDLGQALVQRYRDRFFDALDKKSAQETTPLAQVRSFVQVYKRALVESDRICLCGMLGAESCGLPESVAKPVAAFLNENAEWLVGVLPSSMPKSERRQLAMHILTTLQGAMIVATSLGSHKVFDTAAKDLMAWVESRIENVER